MDYMKNLITDGDKFEIEKEQKEKRNYSFIIFAMMLSYL